MRFTLKREEKFSYVDSGEGLPIIFLHGLMGNLSNSGERFLISCDCDLVNRKNNFLKKTIMSAVAAKTPPVLTKMSMLSPIKNEMMIDKLSCLWIGNKSIGKINIIGE